jgi:hypothetical protein
MEKESLWIVGYLWRTIFEVTVKALTRKSKQEIFSLTRKID